AVVAGILLFRPTPDDNSEIDGDANAAVDPTGPTNNGTDKPVAPQPAPADRFALRFGHHERGEIPSFKDREGAVTVEAFATILEKSTRTVFKLPSKSGWVIGIGSGASGRLSPGATLLWVTASGNWSLGVVGDKGTAVEAAGQIGQRVHVACVRT